jgi:hypothetical protein
MRPSFSLTALLFSVLLVLMLAFSTFADTNATISGLVTDAQGKVVAGVKIVLTNVNTGVAYATESNASGFYRDSELPPGIYRANVSKDGFAGIVKDDIEIHVQDDVSLNFSLRVGSVSESIAVQSGIPL